jgi:short-subunit dehydrogenase
MSHSDELRIWITGAGSGIGEAAAITLGPHHRLVLSGRREQALQRVANSIGRHDACVVVPCDVSSVESVNSAWEIIHKSLGGIDVLVAAAGTAQFTPMLDMAIADFDRQIAVNTRGLFLQSRAVLPGMIHRHFGQIISINSIASLTAFPGCTAYGASKAGSLALTRSLRNEVRDSGIKIHDILLGATETDIWPEQSRVENRHRMMMASDAASVISMLVDSIHNPRLHIEEVIVRPQQGDL